MPDAIAYISRDTDGQLWKKALEAALGPVDFRTLDNLGDKADIEVALAWKPPAGLIASFPNIRLIVSLGMGVDHLLADDKLPAGIPIVRIMDDGLVGPPSRHRQVRGVPADEAVEAGRVRRHAPPPGRHSGSGHDRPGHGSQVRGAGLPDRGLEPDAEDPARHRDVPRSGRVQAPAGAFGYPDRRAAAHPRHAGPA